MENILAYWLSLGRNQDNKENKYGDSTLFSF